MRISILLVATVALGQLRVNFPVTAVAGSDNTLYAISGTNLFRTNDAGANWIASYPTGTPGQPQQVLALASNPLDPATVYVGTNMTNGGVWRSADSGATWTKANAGLPATGTVEKFFTVENQPEILYAKAGTAIYKTSNSGSSWTLQSTLPAAGTIFTINTRTPSLMYFVRSAQGGGSLATIYRSATEGATWEVVGDIAIKPAGDSGLGNSVGALASSPADPDLVFLSTRGPIGTPYTAIHKSSNRGASFAITRAGGNAQRMLIDSNGAIFWTSLEASAGGARVERSTTSGAQWDVKPFAAGIAGEPQLSLDLRHPGHMFAGLSSGLYRSTDSAENWLQLSGAVKATLVPPSAPFDFRSVAGSRITRILPIQFFENSAWAAPFSATVEGANWLTLSALSGTTPATLEVRASTDGLAKGDYSAMIRISSPSSTADVIVPVTLSVTDAVAAPRAYRISLVAGGGTLPPVGAAPTQARLSGAWGVTFDPSGNLMISDAGLNQVLRLRNGVLELVAGVGTRGSTGDGGLATAAQLASPVSLAFADPGDIYLADTLNFRIRRIDTQGIISAFGTADRFFLGGMLFDSAGSLFSVSSDGLRKRTPAGAETKIATGLSQPGQLALDPQGNFLVADYGRHQVLRITPAGVVTVVAGTGTAGYSGDGGPAANAQLNAPRGIAVDSQGNIFIADSSNLRVRMVDPAGNIFTIAGTGVSSYGGDGGLATQATFLAVYSLALNTSGDLFVASGTHIRKLTRVRPAIKPNGVVNAAGYTPDASPGSLVAIFGEDLALGTDAAKSAPWPTTLAGATVTLNGRLMPLYYVSPGQANAMVPYETPLGPATLAVNLGSVSSPSYTLNITQASPGIIAFGENRAVAVNEDGSINTASNPAKPGSALVIYMIGIGPTNLTIATGAAAPLDTLARPTGATTVTLGSQAVTPLFLGLTPGSVALAQLNLKLDDNLPNGDYTVKVTIAGKESNAPVISVRR